MKTALGLLAGMILASSAFGQSWGYTTPRLGGGYNYNDGDGNWSYSTPRLGGGYNYYDSNGDWGYSTPRLGGGYNYYFNH